MIKPLTRAERDALYGAVPWLDDYIPPVGATPIGGWLPFQEARAFARSLKFESKKQWDKYCHSKKFKFKNSIPLTPEQVYEEWVGYADWLGYEPQPPWRSFKKARAFVRSLKIKNSKSWRKYSKSDKMPNDIPSNPDKQYKGMGWISWGDWFGTDSIGTKPFEQWVAEYKTFLSKSKIRHHSSHATWATNIRRKHKKGLLPPGQIKVVETIPGWKWASKEERLVKSLQQKVVELAGMVKKNPKLTAADLKKLGRMDILLGRSRHPEAFAHIKLTRRWVSYDELVPTIKIMVKKNKGTLPSYAAIKKQYGQAMATRIEGAKTKRPDLLKGIKQDSLLKTDEQYRDILVSLQKEHGFIPHAAELRRLGHSGLVCRLSKNPALLKGLTQRKVSNGQPKHERVLRHWLDKYPGYLKQCGGRPGYNWLVEHDAEKLYHMRRTYPEPFEALER